MALEWTIPYLTIGGRIDSRRQLSYFLRDMNAEPAASVIDSDTPPQEFLDPTTRSDPYPLYRWLREREPAHWVECMQGWLITRYADCDNALHDSRLSLADGVGAMFDALPDEAQEELRPLRRYLSLGIGSLDPPEHTRVRAPLNRAFTTRLMRAQTEFIRGLTSELIDAQLPYKRMDVVADLAHPLPAIVIANLLGTGRDQQHLFLSCSDAIGDLFGSVLPSVEVIRRAQREVLTLAEHLDRLMNERRDNSGSGDLLSLLVEAQAGPQPLSRDEVISNCTLLLFAGHLTITSLIATATLVLLRDPGLANRLREDAALIPAAVDEILRYDCPVQMVRRLATADVEIAGRNIAAGEMLWLNLGAANRDPARYDSPDHLKLHRPNRRHLAFGAGMHYCLGAGLSRIETEAVLGVLLQKLSHFRLTSDQLEWHDLPTVRSLKRLSIEFAVNR